MSRNRITIFALGYLSLLSCTNGAKPPDVSALYILVSASEQIDRLDLEIQRAESGCDIAQPPCSWQASQTVSIPLVDSGDGTLQGSLNLLTAGIYRLQALAGDWATPDWIPFEMQPSTPLVLVVTLLKEPDVTEAVIPHFVSISFPVGPLEAGDSLHFTIRAAGEMAPFTVQGFTDTVLPPENDSCPPGGCEEGTFSPSTPIAFDPVTTTPELEYRARRREPARSIDFASNCGMPGAGRVSCTCRCRSRRSRSPLPSFPTASRTTPASSTTMG